ncbi:MAG: DNA-deoxyinosine glycosylase [Planctomycetes bacterium]|nr:DNA-deoxyinosine glycosylase [Planctomycetota bacterium]
MRDVTRVRSFAPVAAEAARVLVVGSMPGVASLQAGRYYAHPRNAFWPIVGAICGFDPGLAYAARLDALCAAGVALWDVLQSCERVGSLDSDIDAASALPNDFAGFFARHGAITAVLCNGGAAFTAYTRRVAPTLPASVAALPVERLPSTSPAHAGMPFDAKLAAWRAALLSRLC